MTCDDADLLLAADALSALDSRETTALAAHVSGCERCGHAAGEYRSVAALLPLALDPVEPPAGLRTRLLARVYAEASASTSRSHPQPRLRDRLRLLWQGLPASRGLTAGAGLVAVAAVAILGIAHARSGGPAYQTPAVAVVSLQGTSAAPAASGTLAYWPGSRQAVITVRGLGTPASASGPGVYEVWIWKTNQAPVPVSFLSVEPDGVTWVAVIDGQNITDYNNVAVTVEPPGGSRVPTGPQVLNRKLSGGIGA